MDDERKSTLIAIGKVIGALGLIAGAVFSWMTASENSLSARLEQQYEMNETLTKRNQLLMDQNILLRIQIADIRRDLKLLKKQVNFAEWQQRDIDSIPWAVKLTDVVIDNGRPLFPTTLINNAFSEDYGISKWGYEGKTSADMWPPIQAAQFYDQNVAAYNARATTLQEMCITHRVTQQKECSPVLRRYAPQPDGSDGMRIEILKGLKMADDCSCEAQN